MRSTIEKAPCTGSFFVDRHFLETCFQSQMPSRTRSARTAIQVRSASKAKPLVPPPYPYPIIWKDDE